MVGQARIELTVSVFIKRMGDHTPLPHIAAGSPAGGLCRLSAVNHDKERNGNGSLPWRSVPDSNRLPLAVLQACFRKHLPTILRAGLVFPGTPQLPAFSDHKSRRRDSNPTMP